MGSGLILLVIVGAWLAVLVPMALRSHEANSSLGTVDKFHDAMRVLARRDAMARITQAPTVTSPVADERPVLSLAERRRRVLLVLVATAGLLLLGAVAVSRWLLLPHLVVDGLAVAYVVHLRSAAQREARRRAVRREQRAATRLAAARALPAPAVATSALQAAVVRDRRRDVPAHVAGIPAQMPARHVVDPAARPLALVPRPDPVRPRGALGDSWSPVPVPVPTYVTAPKARRRVINLTRPAPPATAPAADQQDTGADRRRAVND